MIQEKEFSRGLSTREAEKRIKTYGLNELKHKKKKSPVLIFLSQFNDFLVWVLIGATIISGFIGDKADAITILIIVIVNAILGFVQEFRTEKSLEALQEMAAPTCKAIRDGNIKVINSRELTKGDVVILEAGDRIPADGTFIDAANMVVDESLLTGESVGISKDTNKGKNEGYMGTIVLKGRGLLVVDSIGMETEMGKIANLLDNIEEEKSPLRERLDSLGKILVVVCIIVCIIVTVLGILRGNNITEMFLLGVSLAVAAIPEGLAAIVTVALALGVSRMLKRNALIRKLPAVETLGCTSVICSDKTGTLTQNKMTVKEILTNGKIYELDKENLYDCEKLKEAFVYCNDTNYNYDIKNIDKAVMGDPTETALVKVFFKETKEAEDFIAKANRLFEIPFDSTRKMMTVIMKVNGKETCYMKGAPERVLERCSAVLENGKIKPLTAQKKKQIYNYIESMSNRALRCIAAAYKEEHLVKNDSVEENLIFLGVAGSMDPPRIEVKDAVLKCKMAGIKPIMITGDHKNTALAIAKSINICTTDDQAITGDELEKMSDEELVKRVEKLRVFARVSPNHKLRIVRAFKKNNNIVAMTGDGVNDAPALKRADVGFAMGSGTDVAKEAGSIVILDDNFKSIENAILYGRTIYNNILKFIKFQLTINVGAVAVCAIAPFFGIEEPLKITHILWINLVMDGLGALALGSEPALKKYMLEKPKSRTQSIVSSKMMNQIIFAGAWVTILSFVFLKAPYFIKMFADTEEHMTAYFSMFVLCAVFNGFNVRSENSNIFEHINENISFLKVMGIIILVQGLLTIIGGEMFSCTPISISNWLVIIFMAITIIPVDMIRKAIVNNFSKDVVKQNMAETA